MGGYLESGTLYRLRQLPSFPSLCICLSSPTGCSDDTKGRTLSLPWVLCIWGSQAHTVLGTRFPIFYFGIREACAARADTRFSSSMGAVRRWKSATVTDLENVRRIVPYLHVHTVFSKPPPVLLIVIGA